MPEQEIPELHKPNLKRKGNLFEAVIKHQKKGKFSDSLLLNLLKIKQSRTHCHVITKSIHNEHCQAKPFSKK